MKPDLPASGAGDPPSPALDGAQLCQALLALSRDAVVVCDADGLVLVGNAAAQRMAAQADATWHRMPLPAGWDLVPGAGEDAFPTAGVLADARERRKVQVEVTRPNGKRGLFEVSALPLFAAAGGGLAGAVTAFEDITRRVQLEKEAQQRRDDVETLVAAHARELQHANEMLQRARRFCDAITDAVPLPVAYWERGAVCRFANRAFLDQVGRRAERTLGRTPSDLYGAELEAALQPRMRAALAGQAEAFEVDLPDAAGRRAGRRMHFVPARGRDGALHGVYSVALDAAAPPALQQEIARLLGLVQGLRREADDGAWARRLADLEAAFRRLQHLAGGDEGESPGDRIPRRGRA